MDDLYRDADCRTLPEAPPSAEVRRIFIYDSQQTAWAVDLAITDADLLIRFPFQAHSRIACAPERVFGLEALFHDSTCVVAWISVPSRYRRRQLAAWMIQQTAEECVRLGIRYINGTIEPNDEALPFWLSLGVALEKEGRPVSPEAAPHRRGIKFTIEASNLLALPIAVHSISETDFDHTIAPTSSIQPELPDPPLQDPEMLPL